MIRFLNFIYKGFAFLKPRFGVNETFWVFVFSLILSPIDILAIYYIFVFTNVEFDYLTVYLIVSIILRSIPLFYINPFLKKQMLLYDFNRKQKYLFNAVIAILFFIIFMGFPVWIGVVFILYY